MHLSKPALAERRRAVLVRVAGPPLRLEQPPPCDATRAVVGEALVRREADRGDAVRDGEVAGELDQGKVGGAVAVVLVQMIYSLNNSRNNNRNHIPPGAL